MDEARLRALDRSNASARMALQELVQDRAFSPNDFVVAAHRKSTLGLASGGRLTTAGVPFPSFRQKNEAPGLVLEN